MAYFKKNDLGFLYTSVPIFSLSFLLPGFPDQGDGNVMITDKRSFIDYIGSQNIVGTVENDNTIV